MPHGGKIAEYLRAAVEVARGEPPYLYPVRLAQMLKSRFKYQLGASAFALFDLAHRPERTWDQYATTVTLIKLLRTINPADGRLLADDKTCFYARCLSAGVRTPEILAVIGRETQPVPLPLRRIRTPSELQRFIDEMAPGRELVIKPCGGRLGEKVSIVSKLPGGGLADLDGAPLSTPELATRWLNNADALGFAVQPRLVNHPATREIFTGRGLSTIRVISLLENGTAKILYAMARVSTGSSSTDNFAHGESGNLIAHVDHRSGRLGRMWGRRSGERYTLSEFPVHPATGRDVSGWRLPIWPELVETTLAAARAFPELPCVGWDVAITDDGIMMIEANRLWFADGLQVTLGRGIRRDMEALAASARMCIAA